MHIENKREDFGVRMNKNKLAKNYPSIRMKLSILANIIIHIFSFIK